jgi:hypothetical protein
MNYRRGFRRVFAVLTVAWIVGVLTVSVVHHLKGVQANLENGRAFRFPSGTPDMVVINSVNKQQPKYTGLITVVRPAPNLRYWGFWSSIALLPPAVVFLLVFVVPRDYWVYKPLFKPGTLI